MQHQEPIHKRHMRVMITANTTSTTGINMIQTTIIITAIAVALQIINNSNPHLKHHHHHRHIINNHHHHHHRHLLAVMILISNHTMPCHHHHLLHHRNRSPKGLYDHCRLHHLSSIVVVFLFYDRTKRVSAHVLRSGSPVVKRLTTMIDYTSQKLSAWLSSPILIVIREFTRSNKAHDMIKISTMTWNHVWSNVFMPL